jgi:glycosyltransferase involved in cell wall biosynthesis
VGTTKFKIVYFHQDGLLTGSAISLRHFLSVINREVFEPIVILAKEGPARDLFESLNIQVLVHNFPAFWTAPGPRCFSRDMFNQIGALWPQESLNKLVLQQIKPDLIHINDKAALNVGISFKRSGIPIVQHSRSSYFMTACKLAKYLSARAIKRFTDHIICISEDEEDGFEGFRNKSIIYNTVDFQLTNSAKEKRNQIRHELGLNHGDKLIGFAAHVSEQRGAWDFLELCKRLKRNTHFKFLLAGQLDDFGNISLGDGKVLPISPRSYVDSFIKENNLENQLIVTGFRKDILELIGAMDVIVALNKNGVLGRQPIEAQSLGVTVIAKAGHTNRSKVIEDGVTGFLVENMEECVEQLESWRHAKKAETITNTAMVYAERNFNAKTNMKRIETIYLNLIKH